MLAHAATSHIELTPEARWTTSGRHGTAPSTGRTGDPDCRMVACEFNIPLEQSPAPAAGVRSSRRQIAMFLLRNEADLSRSRRSALSSAASRHRHAQRHLRRKRCCKQTMIFSVASSVSRRKWGSAARLRLRSWSDRVCPTTPKLWKTRLICRKHAPGGKPGAFAAPVIHRPTAR